MQLRFDLDQKNKQKPKMNEKNPYQVWSLFVFSLEQAWRTRRIDILL
jgi:hypothetical protein